MLIPIGEQPDLPPGRVWRCAICRTRVKEGQPHTSDVPTPHQDMTALIRPEVLDPETDPWRGRPLWVRA